METHLLSEQKKEKNKKTKRKLSHTRRGQRHNNREMMTAKWEGESLANTHTHTPSPVLSTRLTFFWGEVLQRLKQESTSNDNTFHLRCRLLIRSNCFAFLLPYIYGCSEGGRGGEK